MALPDPLPTEDLTIKRAGDSLFGTSFCQVRSDEDLDYIICSSCRTQASYMAIICILFLQVAQLSRLVVPPTAHLSLLCASPFQFEE
ncbi:hypothetical protein FH972_005593 [Carpinus fangiana]|uniref:Uncharacterized protein n=1 Tax=Carpinus fangiana TaxID=176857 RepID=A0A5N6QS66_9ROSI|nr:hypothetical protein FH972_005593 [Carpinus fangiana]